MKPLQIQKGLLVISSILLLIISGCKTKKIIIEKNNDTYNIVNNLLSHFDKNNSYKYDTIAVIDTILKFKKDDFFKSIIKIQNYKDKVVSIPLCADTIYYQFDFNKILNNQESNEVVWDSNKIIFLKAKTKSISELVFNERHIKLSPPIFSLKKDLALIKGNHGYHGEVIYFFKKINGIWEVKCELYISQY